MARRVFLVLFVVCTVGCMAIQSDPDPRNELPFGWVDEPANGATVERSFTSHGWALDDNGVDAVRVFLDGHFIARAKVTEARPDVSKIYPKYARGNDVHGWTLTIPLPAGVTLGPHVLVYQAIDNQGGVRDIGAVNIRLEH